ncbi:MotA/TolQ/ExbB proton channel family protein [Bradyrhizobium sp. AUGA SZCCT0240]|uniref:MotA/TolQ/ExbB proton channel family protein n=1 Tax=unclassified Bradyrhizobium TaxID=2631580 RepID=UPI001BA96636|nr:MULTISPECIES: MotA/TolQ/ExbB proton channel family protein [unclassified Bradyrhizobium]MBR1197836.1 MotA/TolQ/ExbB proton channel family protein [Bradyrhizobium sp. AUGA SZCCT0158]MBR1240601.1 MotA/TolQ/ExbB proton channel family protein [Bradyrhizobium sp. AUGA SZCCT0274]MBR1255153.1 MotA/TolQ/ExbB proton channel family protein [Bradyrhizobium sp. AUGA SZCCT0240]
MPTASGDLDSFGDRGPLLRWLVFTGLWIFAFFLLWRFGLIRQMIAGDRTYLSPIIALLYVATSLHCLWRTIVIAREGDAARRTGALIASGSGRIDLDGDAVVVEGVGLLPTGLVAAHIRDLAVKARLQGSRKLDQTLLLRGLASRLRGSNQFGAFASDTLMKLGLLGTIIGFIMMLAPIAGLDPSDRSTVRSSMNLMSDGMAVAMYTTLAGLVGSILVRIQYYMLDDATAKLFAFAVGLTEVRVVSILENRPEAAE